MRHAKVHDRASTAGIFSAAQMQTGCFIANNSFNDAVAAQGLMRTYIATNRPPSSYNLAEGKLNNETWAHYPDVKPLR